MENNKSEKKVCFSYQHLLVVFSKLGVHTMPILWFGPFANQKIATNTFHSQ